jgi:hypothetical protein
VADSTTDITSTVTTRIGKEAMIAINVTRPQVVAERAAAVTAGAADDNFRRK